MANLISYYARRAGEHIPARTERPAQYAVGQPPRDYWGKAARFARTLGYTLEHSPKPREIDPACDGVTAGYIPEGMRNRACSCGRIHDPGESFTIAIAPGLNPAKEYAVVCHELAHAFLRHSPHSEEDLRLRRIKAIFEPPRKNREDFGHEVSAHLASIAACRANGLRIAVDGLGYLADRVRGHGRLIGDEERQAAFLAGRAIAQALS